MQLMNLIKLIACAVLVWNIITLTEKIYFE